MKEIFLQYARYHQWATGLLLDAVAALPAEGRTKPVASSFPSLQATLLHLLDAESIWWQRIKLQEHITRPSETFHGEFAALAAEVRRQNGQWVDYVTGLTEHGLQHEFIYRNLKKQRFKQPVYQVLLHLFNHASYHRGQVVTMLRALGVEKIPETDFIVWSRKK